MRLSSLKRAGLDPKQLLRAEDASWAGRRKAWASSSCRKGSRRATTCRPEVQCYEQGGALVQARRPRVGNSDPEMAILKAT